MFRSILAVALLAVCGVANGQSGWRVTVTDATGPLAVGIGKTIIVPRQRSFPGTLVGGGAYDPSTGGHIAARGAYTAAITSYSATGCIVSLTMEMAGDPRRVIGGHAIGPLPTGSFSVAGTHGMTGSTAQFPFTVNVEVIP